MLASTHTDTHTEHTHIRQHLTGIMQRRAGLRNVELALGKGETDITSPNWSVSKRHSYAAYGDLLFCSTSLVCACGILQGGHLFCYLNATK